MKIHSKAPKGPVVSRSDAKKGVSSKQEFNLSKLTSSKPKHIELFNRIKERIEKTGSRNYKEISRIVTEEMLRDAIGVNLKEKQFQKMVDRVSETVSEDPALSNFINKLMTKL